MKQFDHRYEHDIDLSQRQNYILRGPIKISGPSMDASYQAPHQITISSRYFIIS